MNAHIQPIAGVIRVYAEGDSYNDKSQYTWSATCIIQDDVIEFLGVTRAPTLSEWRAIYRELQDNDIKLAVWERFYNDKPNKKVEVKIKQRGKEHG